MCHATFDPSQLIKILDFPFHVPLSSLAPSPLPFTRMLNSLQTFLSAFLTHY